MVAKNGSQLVSFFLVLTINHRFEVDGDIGNRHITQWLNVKPDHPHHKPAKQLRQVYSARKKGPPGEAPSQRTFHTLNLVELDVGGQR